ncbi:hypothetical protein S7335_834 [Synechococcus sp. PCC 7335]|nr:hypothetical protein S7335_834 [Synechococcus sp. PCC 7335]
MKGTGGAGHFLMTISGYLDLLSTNVSFSKVVVSLALVRRYAEL